MRLLMFTDGSLANDLGGGHVYLRQLVEALAAAGHQVQVTADPAGIRRGKADLVHAHGNELSAMHAARDAGVPCVVTMHHGGLVCPRGSLLDWQDRICHRPVEQGVCTRCCLAGRWWGNVPLRVGKVLQSLPNIPFVTPAMTRPLAVARRREEIASLARNVTVFVAPSSAARDALLRNGVPPERAVVVPHGIKPITVHPVPEPAPVRFAFVGRICHEKGFHVLIDAFRRLRGDPELHVIGTARSTWDKRYLRRIPTPPRVVFHGHLTNDALVSTWARCHVTVSPAICLEVFGLVVQESFSLGRPVIASDSGGPTGQILQAVDGFVVPPNDAAALASAMQRFVDDPQLAAGMVPRLPSPRTMAEHVRDLLAVYPKLQ
jgi:glycosyltransferase involved in cell wall biosynthesis